MALDRSSNAAGQGTALENSPRFGWVVPLALFLGLFAIFATTAARDHMNVDAHAATVEAWHLAATGSPWLEGDLTDAMASNKFIAAAPNGHLVAQRMAGPVILGIPFYWALNNSPTPEDFSFAAGGLAAAFFMALASVLLFSSLRNLLGGRIATGATLVFALATPTWSISSEQLWTHTVTQLGIAGAAFGASRRSWWVAGAFLGLGMLGRPHLALVAAALGLGVALSRRDVRPALQVAIPTLASLGFLAVWNYWMFGVWGIEGAYAGRTAAVVGGFEGSDEFTPPENGPSSQVVNYLGFLVAPDRGLLIWSPMIVLLLPALVRAWGKLPSWSRWLLVGGVLYTLAQLRLNYFPGGDTFWGYRHGLELLTCAAPAVALALPYAGRVARRLLPAVVAAQFAAFALGSAAWGYFVHIENVWTDNSLWLMARTEPWVVGVWFALCIGVALTVAARLSMTSRWPQPDRAVASA